MRRYKEDVRTALAKLPPNHYKTLYIDPPWDCTCGGARPGARPGETSVSRITGRCNKSSVGTTPYVGMKTADLAVLNIARVAATNSHLYLWTVNKTIPDAVKLMEAYGYRWVTMITWDKCKPGIAKYFQGVTEHCIFGVRGSVPYKFKDGKMQQGRTLITERMTDHSRKPAAMREMIERVSYAPYLELFARRAPKNWSAIGLELEDA